MENHQKKLKNMQYSNDFIFKLSKIFKASQKEGKMFFNHLKVISATNDNFSKCAI